MNFYLHSVPQPPAPPPSAVGPRNFGAGTPQEILKKKGPGGNFGNSGVALEDVEQDQEFCEFPAPRDHPWEPRGAARGWNGDSGSCKIKK